MLATFDGPGRGIRCAAALSDELRGIGLQLRAGLHTGEVELRDGDVGGIGVHIAARVMARPVPARSWSPRPCATWWWARTWCWTTAAGGP
jgi:class 3 adenylate cyclase